jgi:hypothetical protein
MVSEVIGLETALDRDNWIGLTKLLDCIEVGIVGL